jgi:acetolactate synthase-1/2/3 large subunit
MAFYIVPPMTAANERHGGSIIADVLARHGVRNLFTLCGGHISPILTGCESRGIKVVDVRDEGHAVFAADAAARLTGTVGVAAVTAGPGVTNTVTALKNAQMAQTPLLLFGGATATLLKGRGSLQDIDQLSLMKPLTKWATTVSTVPSLGTIVERAITIATTGVPAPVFIEVPVDLLYPEDQIRAMYAKEVGLGKAKGLSARALELYVRGHLVRQFKTPQLPDFSQSIPEVRLPTLRNSTDGLAAAARAIRNAERPLIIVGAQTTIGVRDPERVARALRELGAPVYLAGSARGMLGRHDPLQFRHARTPALKEADCVVVCGFPFDFRLGYGRTIKRGATVVTANLSAAEMKKNRRPEIAVEMHPADFLVALAGQASQGNAAQKWGGWFDTLRGRETARDAEIAKKSAPEGILVDPIHFFLRMEEAMADDAILVVDGGDFVATASYIVRPRAPLSWLDPGVFGTLGVGGGFSVGAAASRPGKEIWLVWGDGSSAYSLSEFDTFVRHGYAPIAIIGNDASWAQIAREQVEMLGTALGTELRRTDYHKVAEGYGGVGLVLTDPGKIDSTLAEARSISRGGRPVCINVHLRATDFRKGSISI